MPPLQPLLALLVVILIAAILLWGVKSAPFLDDGLRQLIRIVVIVLTAIYAVLVLYQWIGGLTPVR
jgi:hypothetical protein